MATLSGWQALRRLFVSAETERVWRTLTTTTAVRWPSSPAQAMRTVTSLVATLSWMELVALVVVCGVVMVYALRALAVRLGLVRDGPAACDVVVLDFATYQPPEGNRVSRDDFRRMQRSMGCYSSESLAFMDKMIDRTGLGDATYAPNGALANPPDLTIARAREESAAVMFDVIERVLTRNGVAASAIDILIVNCSLFNPTPSLAAMIVNRFRMRHDIQSYNLSGMGCSAGVISVHLAKQLLAVHRDCRALVVSTENLTQAWYRGNERDMLLPNTLFRVGGAAILLSNKSADKKRGQFRLLHTVRTHLGADDQAYNCIFQDSDADGVVGVRLTRDIARVASRALAANLRELAPKVLPLSELAKAGASRLWLALKRRVVGRPKRLATKSVSAPSKPAPPPVSTSKPEPLHGTTTTTARSRGPANDSKQALSLVPVTVQSPMASASAGTGQMTFSAAALAPTPVHAAAGGRGGLTNALIAATRPPRRSVSGDAMQAPASPTELTTPSPTAGAHVNSKTGAHGPVESPLTISGNDQLTPKVGLTATSSKASAAAGGATTDQTDASAGASADVDDAERPYTPDFARCISHFCIHAGGRGVLDALQRGLKLSDAAMAASRETLRRYGNTSSSSIWYELDVHRQSGAMRRGQRVWQLAFGSGFKCNSAVWEVM